MNKPQIAIIDFGSQYTHLITRRIRQLGVLARIYPPTVPIRDLRLAKGLILSGGPRSVHDNTAIKYNKKLFGGIIIFKDGSCRYNDNETYEYDENNLKNWKFLKI